MVCRAAGGESRRLASVEEGEVRFAEWRGGELKVCASPWLDSKICRTGSRVRGTEGGREYWVPSQRERWK